MSVIYSRKTAFNENPREYDLIRPKYPPELIEDIIKLSNIPKEGVILEIGCGTGQATLPFAKREYKILCLDIGGDLIAKARENLKDYPITAFQEISFEDWRLEENKFDLVMSATAFHWIPPEISYPKAAKALKPSGSLAIFSNQHIRPYTGFFEEVQTIYSKIVPEWENPKNKPSTKETIKQEEEYINSLELYGKVMIKTYPWTEEYTTEQYLQLLNTYSDHRSLDEDKRQNLFTAIANLINSKYNGKIVKEYLSVLYLARKN